MRVISNIHKYIVLYKQQKMRMTTNTVNEEKKRNQKKYFLDDDTTLPMSFVLYDILLSIHTYTRIHLYIVPYCVK